MATRAGPFDTLMWDDRSALARRGLSEPAGDAHVALAITLAAVAAASDVDAVPTSVLSYAQCVAQPSLP
jgi:hypothetical protein